jgi:hypothetical protein
MSKQNETFDVAMGRETLKRIVTVQDREAAAKILKHIAVALLTYYESLPECVHEPRDDETGWSIWALDRLKELDERIAEQAE